MGSIDSGGVIVNTNAAVPMLRGVAYPIPAAPMTRIITTIMASPPSSPARTAGPNSRRAIIAASPRKLGRCVTVVAAMATVSVPDACTCAFGLTVSAARPG